MVKSAKIIPVAGGKGGVGKSVFAANLAIGLANNGMKTVVADLDLGGSNLHSFLGLQNNYPGIGDFLKARRGRLEELLVDTGVENLKFIPGDGQTPLMANIHFEHKKKLIRHIKKIDADFIIVDLGAGSSFNTLDFFAMSSNGIIVTTPELPAIMSAMVFAKNFLFRAFERKFRKYDIIKAYLQSVSKKPMNEDKLNIQDITDHVSSLLPEAGEKMRQLCQAFRPRFVYNMGKALSEFELISRIDTNLIDRLKITPEHFGYIFEDISVRESVNQRKSLQSSFPESQSARSIKRIADRVVRRWDERIDNSFELLKESINKIYAKQNKVENHLISMEI